MPTFSVLNRENESLPYIKMIFDKLSHQACPSYFDIRLSRHSLNFLGSFGLGYWPRVDYAYFWYFKIEKTSFYRKLK